MRYQTELMQSIITDKTAQKMLDFVPPLYGNSYVGLWLFQVNGSAMGEVSDICDALMAETNPVTATLLLDQWEDHYGLPRNSSLTTEQRRSRLQSKIQSGGPCNPAVLEDAVSAALGGVEVDITENVAKNTFLVNIREPVDSLDAAITVLDRMKPAHLIYQIRVATQTVGTAQVKTAVAVTHGKQYKVEVCQPAGDKKAVLGTSKLGTMILGEET